MNAGLEPLYRLRWRFDYADRASKCGMWCYASNRPEEMACFQNTTGLVRACVQAENLKTWETEDVVECDGHDFVEFRWVTAVSMNPLMLQGSFTSPGTIVGLELITRAKRATALVNGKLLVRERTAEEMLNNLDQYRK
jgi:hypothetical protein